MRQAVNGTASNIIMKAMSGLSQDEAAEVMRYERHGSFL